MTVALSDARGNRAAPPESEPANWLLSVIGETGTTTVAVTGLPEVPAAMVASLKQSVKLLWIVQVQPVPLAAVMAFATGDWIRRNRRPTVSLSLAEGVAVTVKGCPRVWTGSLAVTTMPSVGGAAKVMSSAVPLSALATPLLVTVTLTVPAGRAGVVTVSEVSLLTTTDVPGVPPKLTVAPEAKPVPVTVIDVPPKVLSLFRLRAVTVGRATTESVNCPVAVAPRASVTVTV